jgi:Ca-activated chloride channel family protein
MRGRRGGWGLGGTVALLLLAVPAVAAEHRRVPTFGIDVELVSLNLAASDPHGRGLTDVGEAELQVFEDGVRQQISVFARERWPITLAVLIDASNSMSLKLPFAQAAALRLLRTLSPDDRALVAQFSRHLTVLQDYTSDQAALEAAVRSIQIGGDTALNTALYVGLKGLACQQAKGELSRQALVVLSDGADTASAVSEDQVLEQAGTGAVNVYAVGIGDTVGPVKSPVDPRSQYFMSTLARQTGGRAFFPRSLSDLNGVYDGIAEELRTLYGVAYVPSNTHRDGAWRQISIRSLRPNVLLRHRTGYYAPRSPLLARGD